MTDGPSNMLHIDTDVRSDGVVVAVAGEIDLATADDMVSQVAGHLAGSPATLTIDFAGVRFCDSAGINALVRLRGLCVEAGWQFRVVNPQGQVRRVLVDLTGLGELLNIQDGTS